MDLESPITRAEIIENTPLILMGSDVFNFEETKKKITFILAYNELCGSKNSIKFDSKMKPLNKKNEQVSKFYPLTSEQIKNCMEEAAVLVKSIFDVERAEAPPFVEKPQIIADAAVLESAQYLIEHPKEYIEKVLEDFRTIHYGDESVCKSVLRQQAIQCAPRAEGLHIKMSGPSGMGKSSALKSAYKQSPQEYIQIISSSPMGVIYDSELKERSIIMLDDCIPDQPVVDLIKQAITQWEEGLIRKTVVNGESKQLKLPSCISWSLTSCEETKDEQFQNRFQTIHVNANDEKARMVAKFVVEESEKEHASTDTTFERKVIQQVMRSLKQLTFNPIIPEGKLKVLRPKEMRSVKQLIDNMRANAILHYKERNHEIIDGIIKVIVSIEDFSDCIIEFQDSQIYENKLNKCESAIMLALVKSKSPMCQSDLVKDTGFNPGSIHTALVGRKGDNKATTLIERGLISEVTETSGDSCRTTTRRYQANVGSEYLQNAHAICSWDE
jgi:hypothetical protein